MSQVKPDLWGSEKNNDISTHTLQANLRASNEQLRNYVQEVKQDLEGQRNVMLKLQKEKADSMDGLHDRLNLEKNRELAMLRERLIKV
jgi:hypothetical protein